MLALQNAQLEREDGPLSQRVMHALQCNVPQHCVWTASSASLVHIMHCSSLSSLPSTASCEYSRVLRLMPIEDSREGKSLAAARSAAEKSRESSLSSESERSLEDARGGSSLAAPPAISDPPIARQSI
jgi:hypothetical protein